MKGYVYFIRKAEEDIFKIGMTNKTPEIRLIQIQNNTPDELTIYGSIYLENPRELETYLHSKYAEYRLKGEWFNLPEDIVKSILDNHPNNCPIDWIDLHQGHRKFCYQISTKELYIDLSTLRKFSQEYLASLLCSSSNDLKYQVDGTILVKYDLFAKDWPEFTQDISSHKKLLLRSAENYIKTKMNNKRQNYYPSPELKNDLRIEKSARDAWVTSGRSIDEIGGQEFNEFFHKWIGEL